jgi:hypothetical protein
MHGGNSLGYLNSGLISIHLRECGGEEKGRNTHELLLTSPDWAGWAVS